MKTKNPVTLKKMKHKNMFFQTIERLFSYRNAQIGGALLLIIILACVCADWIAPYGFNEMDIDHMNAAPSLDHICGTDALGRDVFTRLLYGGRQSLALGFLSSFFGVFMAIVIGCVAGYFGGMVETVIMRLMDIMSAIPGMLLSMLISTAFGNGLFNTILALAIGTIPSGVRMIRAQILKERSQEYLEAAESINCSKISIMFQHLLPNVISPMIVTFTMGIGSQISAASSLSVLGMGVLPPAPEWGAMLSEGRLHFLAYPHLLLFPGLCIAMTIFAVNLFGDSLRDAIDPKLKK